MTSFDGPTIGKRVARYRQMNGQSAEELATRSGDGFSRPVIANIETGRKKELTVTQLISLSVGLGVSPAALLFDIHKPMSASGLPTRGNESDRDWPHKLVIEAVGWMSGRDKSALVRDDLPAQVHTNAVLQSVQALDDQYFERLGTRRQVEELHAQSVDETLSSKDLAWQEYLREGLQKQDARIAELRARLTGLGVDTSGWGE